MQSGGGGGGGGGWGGGASNIEPAPGQIIVMSELHQNGNDRICNTLLLLRKFLGSTAAAGIQSNQSLPNLKNLTAPWLLIGRAGAVPSTSVPPSGDHGTGVLHLLRS